MEPGRLGDMVAFVAAVRTGSFTAAASSLNVTRSAVGKSVVRLEAPLGARLLNRTTRKLSLTDEGRVAYERWRQILDDLDEVEATMAARRGQPSGTLRLTAPLSFGQRHILPVLDAYMTQWPALRADVKFTDRFIDLIEEGFDIAVRIGAPGEVAQLLTRTIGWQQFATCAAPDYLARRGVPQTPQEVAEHDIIAFLSRERPNAWRYQTPDGLYLREGPGRLKAIEDELFPEGTTITDRHAPLRVMVGAHRRIGKRPAATRRIVRHRVFRKVRL